MVLAFANMTIGADIPGFVAPTPLPTPADAISLWWCILTMPAQTLSRIADWLAPAERARMERFAGETLRTRYLVGRASLRWILANAVGASPRGIPIERGLRGRPRLAGNADIDFNVSHTADVALIGLSRAGRIGVDVERADRVIQSAGLARRILTDRERAALPSHDSDAIRRRILRLWTCKEALAKSTGDAMSAPFRRLDIQTEPMLALAGGPAPYHASDFALFAAAVPGRYLGTVALWRPRNAAAEFNRDRASGPLANDGMA
jgi:4'-phosphopantetheinyl transferase